MTSLAHESACRSGRGAAVVIAHRGASALAPENTVAAFNLAADMGAAWIELDCTLSRDGVLMVIHDPALDRTTSGAGPVGDRTLAELRMLDAGVWKDPAFAGERIPTLDEALDCAMARNLNVYIEIKDRVPHDALERRVLADTTECPLNATEMAGVHAALETDAPQTIELVCKTIQAVRRSTLEERVVIQSFSAMACAAVRVEAPVLRVELLAAPGDDVEWAQCLTLARRLELAGLNVQHQAYTLERVAVLHAAGLTTAAWTVDEPEDMVRLAAWGVDAIITNRPDAALTTLGTEDGR